MCTRDRGHRLDAWGCIPRRSRATADRPGRARGTAGGPGSVLPLSAGAHAAILGVDVEVPRDGPFLRRVAHGEQWLEIEVRVADDEPAEDPLAWRLELRAGEGAHVRARHAEDLVDDLEGFFAGPFATCGARLYLGATVADASSGSSSATHPRLHVFSWPLAAGGRPATYEGSLPLGSYSRCGFDTSSRGAGSAWLWTSCRPVGLQLYQQTILGSDDGDVPEGWQRVHGAPERCGTADEPGQPPDERTRWLATHLDTCRPAAPDADGDACTARAVLWHLAPASLDGHYEGQGALHYGDEPHAFLAAAPPPVCVWASPALAAALRR